MEPITTVSDNVAAFAALSDDELVERVKHFAACERRASVALIRSLVEFDARRLYLREGCSSLFTYCTHVLHLSEGSAYNRIETARAARRYPTRRKSRGSAWRRSVSAPPAGIDCTQRRRGPSREYGMTGSFPVERLGQWTDSVAALEAAGYLFLRRFREATTRCACAPATPAAPASTTTAGPAPSAADTSRSAWPRHIGARSS